jgi:hypothetical protein
MEIERKENKEIDKDFTKLHKYFVEGLINILGLQYESKEIQMNAVKDVEENWFFCGGRDGNPRDEDDEVGSISQKVLIYWEALWRHHFPNRDFPQFEPICICKKHVMDLRYNCYITNPEKTKVITIGRICMVQFIKKSKDYMSKRCERCLEPHKNRKDNYCNKCRLTLKEEKEEEERQRVLKEEEERMERQRIYNEERQKEIDELLKQKMEEIQRERIAKQEQEEKEKLKCSCGNSKKEKYQFCWDCNEKQRCSCGNYKKKEYDICYECKCKKMGWIYKSDIIKSRLKKRLE